MNMIHRFRYLIAAFFVLLAIGLVLAIPAGHAADDADLIAPADKAACTECHEDIDLKAFGPSAHGKLNCQDCHKGVNQYPHPEAAIAHKPACESCHAAQKSSLAHSVHAKGKGTRTPPNCRTCHGDNAHVMTKLTQQTPEQRESICLTCHANAMPGKEHHAKGVTCFSCHGENPHGLSLPASKVSLCQRCHTTEAGAFRRSAHGTRQPGSHAVKPNCLTCHDGPHYQVRIPAKPVTACQDCHADKASALAGSVHRKTKMDCFTCHGSTPHTVSRFSNPAAPRRDAVCVKCHASEAGRLQASAHGIQAARAGVKVDCLSCHGDNPHAVHSNLKLTSAEKPSMCQQCHTGIAKAFAGSAHGKHAQAVGEPAACLTCHGSDFHSISRIKSFTPAQRDAACAKCHGNIAKTLATSVHGHADPSTGKPPHCLACHDNNPHTIKSVSRTTRLQREVFCRKCHFQKELQLEKSVHDRPDKVPGDHPTCLSCHGWKSHGIQKPDTLTAKKKIAICERCHKNAELMSRYGITTDTVPAYENTMHGKAILKLGNTKAATCVDCHGIHEIIAPQDKASPTHLQNVANVCNKCHKDRKKYFAFSYASHFRLGVERTVITPLEYVWYMCSLLGAAVLLLLSIAMIGGFRPKYITADLWQGVYLMGFFAALIGLASAWSTVLFRESSKQLAWLAAFSLLGAVIIAHLVGRIFLTKKGHHE